VRAGVIAPVVPPLLPNGGTTAGSRGVVSLVHEPLPLPSLISRRMSTVVYGVSALDDRGRVADRVVMRALGWSAGRRLDIREASGVLTVLTASDGGY
jgi:hypothetical protein